MGRVFMAPLDDPFAVVLREIEALRAKTRVIIVDFHAEATSEKVAMGWHLDGRVTAVVGTHTHVQTADERILPKGTAYLTDVGMTGPHDSIIGVTVEAALGRLRHRHAAKFEAATGAGRLNARHRHRPIRRPAAPARSSGSTCRREDSRRWRTRARGSRDLPMTDLFDLAVRRGARAKAEGSPPPPPRRRRISPSAS